MGKSDLLARVKQDLALGHTHAATHRLRTFLSAHPDDLRTRCLLGEVYRRTGNLAEAGRWYFLSDEIRPEELAAFERANPSAWLRLRLLRYGGRERALPPGARARLRRLEDAAERSGPPQVWQGPAEPGYDQPRGIAFPCLFVVIALTVFAVLAAVGVARVVLWILSY